MHIKIYIASIDQHNLSRHKDLKLTKAAKKGLLNDYFAKNNILHITLTG